MAAASSFNGFTPTEKMYVCSVQPEFFEGLIAGPTGAETATVSAEPSKFAAAKDAESEEKKEDVVCC